MFIKILSNEKDKYKSCQKLKWLTSLKLQWCELKSSKTTLYTSFVICDGVYLTKLHTKVARCNSAKKFSIAIVQFNVVICNSAYRKSAKW